MTAIAWGLTACPCCYSLYIFLFPLNPCTPPCVLIYLLSVPLCYYSRIPNFLPLPPDLFLFLPLFLTVPFKCLHTCCSSVCVWFTASHYKRTLARSQTHRGGVSGEGPEPLRQSLAPGAGWPGCRNKSSSRVKYLWGESTFLWPSCHLGLKESE